MQIEREYKFLLVGIAAGLLCAAIQLIDAASPGYQFYPDAIYYAKEVSNVQLEVLAVPPSTDYSKGYMPVMGLVYRLGE